MSPSVLYLHIFSSKASPKAISRRTSYLRVRLEFLRYPQFIRCLFNDNQFGPPQDFTLVSSWPWIGHLVSGLLYMTCFALFRLAFASAPYLKYLTLPYTITRWTVLQKVRYRTYHSALSACKHRVSDSISLPSRGSFRLSLTVLVHYRSPVSI